MSFDEAVTQYQPQDRREAYELGLQQGILIAIRMLEEYEPGSEEVTSCMHSDKWAAWLREKTQK